MWHTRVSNYGNNKNNKFLDLGLWGKDGFGGEREREMSLWGKESFEREKYTGKEDFEREKDTGGGHGRGKQELHQWGRRKREKEKWGFDCVWLRLDFYFQNAYVASSDWGCKSGVLHGLRIEFNLIDDGVWVRRNFVWWRVIVRILFFLAYASSSST